MSTNTKILEAVYHVAMQSDKPRVITDYLHLARVDEHGLVAYRETYKKFSKQLLPGGPYADLVGKTVGPDARRKRIEAWARGRGLTALRSQYPMPEFSTSLTNEIESILSDDAKIAPDSPRKLSPDAARALRKLGHNVEVKREHIAPIMDVIKVLQADVRFAAVEALGQRTATEFAKENAELNRKLLRHSENENAAAAGPLN